MNRKVNRIRRARRTRYKLRELKQPRVQIVRSSRHISAQLVSASGAEVLAQASTMEAALREHKANVGGAEAVGKLLAERIAPLSLSSISFDRSGYKYHGKVMAVADALRAGGLKF